MKIILITIAMGLFAINAFASSKECETAINNVVIATAKYESLLSNKDIYNTPYDSITAAFDEVNKSVETANNVCK